MYEFYALLAIVMGAFFAFRFHMQDHGWGWGCLYGIVLMPVALTHALFIVVTTCLALRVLGASPIRALVDTITTSIALETSIRTTWSVVTKESLGANQYLERASKHLEQGRYDDAIRNLDRAIDLDPSNVSALVARGIHFNLRSQYGEAIEDLNGAITQHPSDASLYVKRGGAWLGLREFGSAIEDLNMAVSLNPDAEAFMARGDARTENEQYVSAMEDYERAIALSPSAEAYISREESHFKLDNFDNALRDSNRAIALDKTNPDACMHRGNVYLAQGVFDTAREEFTKAIGLVPEVVDMYSDTLELLESDTELALYERIVKAQGGMYCNTGFCYLGLGENNKAIQDFDAAIKLQPENVDFYCARSTAHVQTANFADGAMDLDTAIQLDSTDTNALFMRSVLSFNSNDVERAVEESSRAINLQPRRCDFYCVRGRSQLHLGDYRSAIADFDKAIEAESKVERTSQLSLRLDRLFAYACRGLSHLLLGNHIIARCDLGKALALGYGRAEMEEEIAELVPEEKCQNQYLDVVRSIDPDIEHTASRKKQETEAVETTLDYMGDSDNVDPRPRVEEPNTLDREGCIVLFRQLGCPRHRHWKDSQASGIGTFNLLQ